MKTLKMSLANLQGKMSRKEMKDVFGGQIIQPSYSCSCSSGANPPYRSSWEAIYGSSQEILNDINRYCIGGSGTCRQQIISRE